MGGSKEGLRARKVASMGRTRHAVPGLIAGADSHVRAVEVPIAPARRVARAIEGERDTTPKADVSKSTKPLME